MTLLSINVIPIASSHNTTVTEEPQTFKKNLITQIKKLQNLQYEEEITNLSNQRIKNFLAKYKIDIEKKFTKEEQEKINQIARKYKLLPEWVYFVFYKESRLNPEAKNAISGAYGLIQILPKTAQNMGTSISELKNMSILEYLDYVDKYFQVILKNKKINSIVDTYLAVFYPKAVNKPFDYVIGNNNHVVKQNKGIDINNDNIITKSEFAYYTLKT